MPQYMLLLHGDEHPDLSPEEMQRIVSEYVDWALRLRSSGHLVDGNELGPGGKLLKGHGSALQVTDGPFAEGKEEIGGYFVIQAGSEEEAVALASECPGLRRGWAVQLRPIMDH